MVATTFLWATAALVATTVSGAPMRARRGYHQQFRRSAPSGFTSLGSAPSSQTLNLKIALTSANAPGLEDALLDVSTPSSANYGKHLTKDQVNAYLAPTPQALEAVTTWLTNNDIATTTRGAGDWLAMNITVAKANALLGASFETFQHSASGSTYARTLSLALPDSVSSFIEHIFPTTEFNSPVSAKPLASLPQGRHHRGGAGGGGAGGGAGAGNGGGNGGGGSGGGGGGASPITDNAAPVTPATLQALYGIPTTPATNANNTIAVAGFDNQFANDDDLSSFLQQFRTDIDPSTTFAVELLDDGQNSQDAADAGTEALDIQYTVGVATGVPITFVSAGEDNQDGDLGGFLDMVNFLEEQDSLPQVFTTSYGENEDELPDALAIKLCTAYAGLGARGTSVLFASGDGAVAGGQAQECTTFLPAFPGTCPYLTSVGSTFTTNGQAPETAASFSSGGFSNIFAIPSYQADAVQTYLGLLGSQNEGLFNSSGRGYPDVAAQGENVQIVVDGQVTPVDGTSCSSPIFASVVSLINDQLATAGKAPLGFLNPFLYANAAALTDITAGNNPGCNTDGFPALKGWDPVTGLGTPNFAALVKAAGL
ncbi:Family S53 protease [Mycena chlorophos]|uniref:Family S53 protease n=1 Tax=Mycena chlorophos TaxID=658473 RepID=A0A8H6T145_MYCCL|nr:Family S53 protease [Mycena chlorophos]